MYVRVDLLRPFLIKEKFSEVAKKILLSKKKFSTSVSTLFRLARDIEYAKKDISLLKKIKKLNLEILPLTKEVFDEAFKIKKKYKLDWFDAIDGATCLKFKLKMLSHEVQFDKVRGIERTQPAEFAKTLPAKIRFW
jgi:predicted nucleic acid-binding protein